MKSIVTTRTPGWSAALVLLALLAAAGAGFGQTPPLPPLERLEAPALPLFPAPPDAPDAPAPRALLADLPTLPDEDPDPNIVQVTLDVRMAPVDVSGVTANLFTYNGLVPGGVIRAKSGDLLRIHFQNSLPSTSQTNLLGFTRNITNLHVHGMHVTPMDPGDNAALAILPGQSHDYEYDLMMQRPGCLNFYHTHAHGLVAEQYWGGLVGPIVIEDPPLPALDGVETHLLVLKDLSLSGADPAPHSMMSQYMHGMEGSIVMVNGQVNPGLTLPPGKVQRWRVLNASNARFYKLSLEGHALQVIGTDGGLLDKPYPQSYLLMAPGERADILVKASATAGTYHLLALPYARQGGMGTSQVTLLTMTVSGSPVSDTLPAVIDPSAARIVMDTTMLPHRTYELGMTMMRGTINGKDFDVDPDSTMSMVGDYEVWTITNPGGMGGGGGMSMDHPWHQHVDAAQVLSITGGDAAYASLYTTAPAMKDTTIVPRGGSITLLVPVMDWPGMAMYHCHILEHEDIGMMGMWDRMGMMPGEVTGGLFCPGSKDCLAWDPCMNAATYDLHEGAAADLPLLLTGAMDSCLRWSGSAATTGTIALPDPPAGSFHWYLVVGRNGMMRGSAGNATAGPRILDSMGACP